MTTLDKLILVTAAILANWRLAYMLTQEAAPFGLLTKLRWYIGAHPSACGEQAAARNITNVFCCVRCMSVWTALIIGGLLLIPNLYIIIYVLALSAGAIILQKVIG